MRLVSLVVKYLRIPHRVNLTQGCALECYTELFSQSIIWSAERECVLPLFGGRDSRHILFELCCQEQ